MSDQAIETDETVEDQSFRIEEDAEVETEQESDVSDELDGSEQSDEPDEDEQSEQSEDDDGEVEIVLEGEAEPTSTPVKPSRFQRRIGKLKGEVQEVSSELEAERQRAEYLEEQNKLLRQQMEERSASKAPEPGDFESDDEFEAAQKDYQQKQIQQLAREEAARIVEEAQSHTNQAQVNQERETAMLAHYERAEKSKIPNYEALEDAAIEAMGKTAVTEIMVNTEQSHVVLAHLGSRPEKAERYARLLKTSPVKGLLEIGALSRDLRVQRKTPPPADPETDIEKGLPATDDPFLKGVRFS